MTVAANPSNPPSGSPEHIPLPCYLANSARIALVEWLLRGGRRDFQNAQVRYQKLDEALARLHSQDPTAAAILQLHLFAGRPLSEIAIELGRTLDFVDAAYLHARAFLTSEIDKNH